MVRVPVPHCITLRPTYPSVHGTHAEWVGKVKWIFGEKMSKCECSLQDGDRGQVFSLKKVLLPTVKVGVFLAPVTAFPLHPGSQRRFQYYVLA